MLNKLKSNNGNGTAIGLMLVLIVSIMFGMPYFYKQIELEIINYQKHRYQKAVDMAVKTSMATIELTGYQDINNASDLDKIALGYSVQKELKVDKQKLCQIFYSVLWKNINLETNEYRQELFKRYIPLKALVEGDSISLSTYDDVWYTYRLSYDLGFESGGPSDKVFFTLTDKYYRLKDNNLLNYYDPSKAEDPTSEVDATIDTPDGTQTVKVKTNAAFMESNKIYFTLNPKAPAFDSNDLTTPYIPKYKSTDDLTEAKKNQIIAQIIQNHLNGFVNDKKVSQLNYNIRLGDFDERKFLNATKDITFFCLVEGIPIKSVFSQEPDKSFYTFSFGGASIKRIDE